MPSCQFQRASTIIGIYPEGHKEAAVIPLLDLAQRQLGKSMLLSLILQKS